jgi:DNA polymerase-1
MLQVHDELVFEIRTEVVKQIVPKLKTLMEGVLSLEETQSVPILVEAKVGDNWDEMQKI